MNLGAPALHRLARALQARGYRFTTVTPATHARVNARPEKRMAATVEDVFGWSRPFQAEVLPAGWLAWMDEAGVLAGSERDGWRSRVRFSSLGEQLFVHSAYPTSAADAIFFGPDTYRFAAAIERHLAAGAAPRRVVDIGCGAGPGAIVVARRCPEAEVIAVDINADALRATRLNAELAGAANVECLHSDLLGAVGGRFDLIVANPPYLLDGSERAYRHGGGALGEALSLAIAGLARERLAPGGTLLLYTGAAIVAGSDRLRLALEGVLDGLAWCYAELDPDVFGEELLEPAYARADRIAAVLVTARLTG